MGSVGDFKREKYGNTYLFVNKWQYLEETLLSFYFLLNSVYVKRVLENIYGMPSIESTTTSYIKEEKHV